MARSVIGSITGASMTLVMVSATALRYSRMMRRPRARRQCLGEPARGWGVMQASEKPAQRATFS